MGDIRIGKVSSIDYENGMIRVLYTDRDGAVTKTLPVVTFNDEYKMPYVLNVVQKRKRDIPERDGLYTR